MFTSFIGTFFEPYTILNNCFIMKQNIFYKLCLLSRFFKIWRQLTRENDIFIKNQHPDWVYVMPNTRNVTMFLLFYHEQDIFVNCTLFHNFTNLKDNRLEIIVFSLKSSILIGFCDAHDHDWQYSNLLPGSD